jgi:hypothetical protein
MATETVDPSVDTDQQKKLLATGTLFHALAADPKYRKDVLSLIKKAAPDTPIPELDLEAQLLKALDERNKPTTEENKQVKDRLDAIERRLVREEWAQKNGLSEEEAVEVESLAKQEQIGKGEAAVELWRSRQALGTPRGTRPSMPGTEEYLKKLQGVSPANGKRLKVLAEEEASRIMSTLRKKVS